MCKNIIIYNCMEQRPCEAYSHSSVQESCHFLLKLKIQYHSNQMLVEIIFIRIHDFLGCSAMYHGGWTLTFQRTMLLPSLLNMEGHGPPKWCPTTMLHGVTMQRITNSLFATVKTSNPHHIHCQEILVVLTMD